MDVGGSFFDIADLFSTIVSAPGEAVAMEHVGVRERRALRLSMWESSHLARHEAVPAGMRTPHTQPQTPAIPASPSEHDSSSIVRRHCLSTEPLKARLHAFGTRFPTLLYIAQQLTAQLMAIVPIFSYMALFRLIVLDGVALRDGWTVVGGLAAVMIGLFFFMDGLNFALMPIGEALGHFFRHTHLALILFFVFLLGVLVTLCEPAINALQTLGETVDASQSPHLFYLVQAWSDVLLLFVGCGVGVASVLGVARIRRGWSIKPFVLVLVPLALVLSYVGVFVFDIENAVALAWDTGGVTTGPVTVPIMIAFGIGVGGRATDVTVEGFGIVTLASLVPVIAVLLQSFLLLAVRSADELAEFALEHQLQQQQAGEPDDVGASPLKEIVLSIRSVVPLAVLLVGTLKLWCKPLPRASASLVQTRFWGEMPGFQYSVALRQVPKPDNDVVLEAGGEWDDGEDYYSCDSDADGDDDRDSLAYDDATDVNEVAAAAVAGANNEGGDESTLNMPPASRVAPWITSKPWLTTSLGIVACLLGATLFNIGLAYGLATLGEQVGALLPAAFTAVDGVHNSPYYSEAGGTAIVFFFALLLGFLVTFAEPGLQVMGRKIEATSGGEFRRVQLVAAVASGVAIGMAIGILRIALALPLVYFLTALYAVALLLTVFSSEDVVNVAWDSAGVTTGPITVPFVLSLGLNITRSTNGTGGFGILALSSVCPVISVLAFGLYTRLTRWRRLRASTHQLQQDMASHHNHHNNNNKK
jgi:hypothetical protein